MRKRVRNYIIMAGLAVCLVFGNSMIFGRAVFAAHQIHFYGIVSKTDSKGITVVPFTEAKGAVKGKSIKLLADDRDNISDFDSGERVIVHYMPSNLEKKERIKEFHVRLSSQVSKMDSVRCEIVEKPKHGKIKVKLTEKKDDLKKGTVITLLCKEADDCKDIYTEDFKTGRKLKVYYYVKLNVKKTAWIGSVENQIQKES